MGLEFTRAPLVTGNSSQKPGFQPPLQAAELCDLGRVIRPVWASFPHLCNTCITTPSLSLPHGSWRGQSWWDVWTCFITGSVLHRRQVLAIFPNKIMRVILAIIFLLWQSLSLQPFDNFTGYYCLCNTPVATVSAGKPAAGRCGRGNSSRAFSAMISITLGTSNIQASRPHTWPIKI